MPLSNSGVYVIRHLASGKVYVGSSVNIRRRWVTHNADLKQGTHHNAKLQSAWAKYGSDAFEFSVLEVVSDKSALTSVEQHWIDALRAVEAGYNICPVAGNLLGIKKTLASVEKTAAAHRGMKRSEETRAKIRAARARQVFTAETRAKLSAATSRRVITQETRAKLSAAMTGRKMSPEACLANSKGQTGLKRAPDAIAKVAAAHVGRKHTAEAKAKMSAWQIGRKMSPESVAKSVANRTITDEIRAKLSIAGRSGKGRKKPAGFGDKIRAIQTGRTRSAETRQKLSEAGRGRVCSAETIAKRVATRAANRNRAPDGQAFQA